MTKFSEQVLGHLFQIFVGSKQIKSIVVSKLLIQKEANLSALQSSQNLGVFFADKGSDFSRLDASCMLFSISRAILLDSSFRSNLKLQSMLKNF